MAIVKNGYRYLYNPTNGSVYPYSSDFAKNNSLIAFTAKSDGPFEVSMTLAGSSDKPKKAAAVKAKTKVVAPAPESVGEEETSLTPEQKLQQALREEQRQERGNEDGSREEAHEIWLKAQAEAAKQGDKSEALNKQAEAASNAEVNKNVSPVVTFDPLNEPE